MKASENFFAYISVVEMNKYNLTKETFKRRFHNSYYETERPILNKLNDSNIELKLTTLECHCLFIEILGTFSVKLKFTRWLL